MRQIRPGIVLCVVVAACGKQPASSAPTPIAQSVATPVGIPASVGRFRLVETRPVNGLPTDTIYRFTDSTKINISVIRYAVPADVKIGSDSSVWLEREGAKFAAIQPILRQRDVIQAFEIKLQKTASVQLGSVPVAEHLSVVQTRARYGVFNELEYLYVIGGRFLKVRISEPETGATKSDSPMFARELARQVLLATRR